MSRTTTDPQTSEPAGEADAKDTGRLEAFSDGVFSIALTLLVLELKVPSLGSSPGSPALWWALAAQWPGYLAFVTSFFTVLIMWVNHHSIFRLVVRCNATLLFANGLLLLLVTVVPFPTALVTAYLRTPAASAACAAYCATFVAVSIAFGLLLVAASRENGTLLAKGACPHVRRRIRDCFLIGTPLYLLATVSALFVPWLSLAIISALWIYWSAWGVERGPRAEG